MQREEKREFVKQFNSVLKDKEFMLVANYQGLNVAQISTLRSQISAANSNFKVAKNTLAKMAIKNTNFEMLEKLFVGPTSIAYSDDPVAPAKVAINFDKKFEKFKVIGGGYDGEKINLDKINFLATLPSMDQLRGKIVGLISAPAQKVASLMKEPSAQVARLISAQNKSLEKSN